MYKDSGTAPHGRTPDRGKPGAREQQQGAVDRVPEAVLLEQLVVEPAGVEEDRGDLRRVPGPGHPGLRREFVPRLLPGRKHVCYVNE